MRIGLLGTLAVYDEDGRLVRVGGSRVRILLILLALDAGRVVPSYSLIERLWADDPPANSGNSLQSLVSRLRTLLRDAGLGDQVVESHPAGYRLAVSPDEVDALAFESLARAGSQALASGDAATAARALREALGSWRGPALADASGARFAAGPAARLEELRTRAALDLVEAGLALGETDSLIGELRAMIAADPVAERPRGLLMRVLYAAGRQAEALGVYSETRELLASELGVDPSPQLEQVHLGVLRQDLQTPGTPRPNGKTPAGPGDSPPPASRPAFGGREAPRLTGLRTPLTSFVGRDEDVARVRKMLAEGRLVTLTGPGGAGKTRLAIETAAQLAGCAQVLPAGTAAAAGQAQQEDWQVRLVELTSVADPSEVPYAVLHALGIRESPIIVHAGTGQLGAFADPVERLLAALADRSDLLILDNCEHVVAAAATLADQVLAACPGVRVLVTSREPLRITGEALWPVPPLPVPPPMPNPVAPGPAADQTAPEPGLMDGTAAHDPAGDSLVAAYASVRLLADRAAAVHPDFRVDAGNAADVARICRALDGMPLAIELAAARLRTLSAAQLAQRLDARFELLTGGSRTAVPRHQTLRAVVDWSWELLSEREQVLARRLAIFPGGVTLTVAEQVCQDAALPAQAILPTVFGLVEKSFLTVADSAEPQYRMLETIRAYCLERLAEAGEEDQVRQASATYYLRLAETADPLLRGGEQHTWMRRLTAEQDNIYAALRWAVDRRDAALALRFGQALGWFWMLGGKRRESGALAGEILAVSEPSAPDDPAHRDLGVVHARAVCALILVNGTLDIARVRQPLADAEMLLAQAPGAGGGEGHSDRPLHPLVVIGGVMLTLYERRDPHQALRMIAAQFESADPWTRWGARLMHALFSMNMGRLDDVAQRCAEALAGFGEIGDRWGLALALVGQSELAIYDGHFDQAIAALERAVQLSRELTDWEDTAQMHATLAKCRSRRGDLRGALADMARARRAVREQGECESDLWIGYIDAELAWLSGDLAGAGRLARRLDTRMSAKNTVMTYSFQAQAKNRAALVDIRSGDVATGWAGLAEALRLARESQERAAVAIVLDGIAAAALWTEAGRSSADRPAVLLGAAHSIRGAFDHSSLDAPGARDTARQRLGGEAFEAAYQRGRELGYEEALALAEDCVQPPAST
ncbi:MAG TPA: BTAD domain-containing putative transcriptional regulator [Streptosporangiaceae bacterium]|nr:BTAD domain-containing putative transcriptional regulator [Streptosporangiaceae bacterium]